MRLTNTRETYGLVHQLLHWTTAALILSMLPLGIYMHELPVGTAEEVADKVWLYSLHKTIGIAALLVALLRIGWAVVQPHPNLIHGGWEAFAAKTVHWLLYGAIVAMPLFGWLHHAALEGYAPIWFWPIGDTLPFVPKSEPVARFFGIAHKVTGIAIVLALLLHIGGALKHALVDKDRTLARMVPGAYEESGYPPPPKGHTASSFAAALFVAVLGTGVITSAWAITGGHLGAAGSGKARTIAEEAGSTGAWVIDRETSELAIEVQQLGSPVRGTFGGWTADVVFDPDAPEAASIRARVDVASLALSDVSERATSDEFLDAAAHPEAVFTADEIVRTDGGFDARGTLQLAGVEKAFSIPFTFREENGRAFVSGEAVIQRLDFGVGSSDTSGVGPEVKLILSIEATRPQASAGS